MRWNCFGSRRCDRRGHVMFDQWQCYPALEHDLVNQFGNSCADKQHGDRYLNADKF
jgi:hypothetical protein